MSVTIVNAKQAG